MANDVSTIQSLKAVDAWIDVINANINGGVRTAFKASRLRFAGTNTQLDRAPTSTTLPLQLPEPGLITANTVIDWTQGAITSSTETTHLAIQGEGFFLLASSSIIDQNAASASFGATVASTSAQFYFTRDGEFHTDRNGFLVNASGLFVVTYDNTYVGGRQTIRYNTTTINGTNCGIRAIFNDLDNPGATPPPRSVRLSEFIKGFVTPANDAGGNALGSMEAVVRVDQGRQNLRYSSYGSTVYDFGYRVEAVLSTQGHDPNITFAYATSGFTILPKSLEASNSSMTQSVPELSLAQKLFSALTKVLQIGQTNTDSVLNLVR